MSDKKQNIPSLKDRVAAGLKSKQAVKLEEAMKENIVSYSNPIISDVVLEGEAIIPLDCADIDANPFQNRRSFDEDELNDLANSIKENGQSQPIVVRKNGDRYQIVSGERRWRACSNMKIKVDAVVRDVSHLDMTYNCYAENDSRKKIYDFEKSLTIQYLIEQGRPTDEIVRRLNMTSQDFYKLNKFQQMPTVVQDFLEVEPKALQRNEVADLFKLQKDLGGTFTSEMDQTLVELLSDYVAGKLSNRGQIVKLFKQRYVTPKTRNRPKVNQEEPLLWGEVKVGTLVNTPSQVHFTIEKAEMDKDTLEKLQSMIVDFISAQ